MSELWGDKSFLLEMKPRALFGSVYVDCPPLNDTEDVQKRSMELLHLMPTSLQFISIGAEDNEDGTTPEVPSADFCGIELQPKSVSAMTFADQTRLFMCKVGVKVIGFKTDLKNFYQLEKDIADEFSAEQLVELAKGKAFRLNCFNCNHLIISSEPGQYTVSSIKTDDYLHTTPEMEFFCGHCCGGSSKCGGSHDLTEEDRKMVQSKWFPTSKRVVVSPSYLMVVKDIIPSKAVKIDSQDSNGTISCHQCTQQIGCLDKRFKNICLFHTWATKLNVGSPKSPDSFLYFDRRFGNDDRFFAWMLLSQCDSQQSLKLVVRTLDKRPYLLLWLLESYVIMTKGVLKLPGDSVPPTASEEVAASTSEQELAKENKEPEAKSKRRRRRKSKSQEGPKGDSAEVSPAESATQPASNELLTPFPALKMLFKVFDESTAVSDPRANGEDASVGLVDVPLSCVLRLTELLLERANGLPPTLRSVGQFYVGYLKLNDGFDPIDEEN